MVNLLYYFFSFLFSVFHSLQYNIPSVMNPVSAAGNRLAVSSSEFRIHILIIRRRRKIYTICAMRCGNFIEICTYMYICMCVVCVWERATLPTTSHTHCKSTHPHTDLHTYIHTYTRVWVGVIRVRAVTFIMALLRSGGYDIRHARALLYAWLICLC
ncbi:hypothetical protein F4859DRAFT_51197 [Xylaria cf. heliscus]|nr:hypothetical protein F4859DRAFT_51197 [Xylaria cf. heliscus]